jgi:heme-degrading monooxygenase HmoA
MKNFFTNSVPRITLFLSVILLVAKPFFPIFFDSFVGNFIVWAVIVFASVILLFDIMEYIQKRKNKKFSQKNQYLRLIDKLSSSSSEEKDFLVYENNKDGDFETLFGSFNQNLKNLAFESKEQIETFCKENRHLLRTEGYGTFFLYTEKVNDEEEFFVAHVYLYSAELRVYVNHLSDDRVWRARRAHRIVVLVTKPLDTQS